MFNRLSLSWFILHLLSVSFRKQRGGGRFWPYPLIASYGASDNLIDSLIDTSEPWSDVTNDSNELLKTNIPGQTTLFLKGLRTIVTGGVGLVTSTRALLRGLEPFYGVEVPKGDKKSPFKSFLSIIFLFNTINIKYIKAFHL